MGWGLLFCALVTWLTLLAAFSHGSAWLVLCVLGCLTVSWTLFGGILPKAQPKLRPEVTPSYVAVRVTYYSEAAPLEAAPLEAAPLDVEWLPSHPAPKALPAPLCTGDGPVPHRYYPECSNGHYFDRHG